MDDYKYILASSKLLPNYGFPAGLDVVDKAAIMLGLVELRKVTTQNIT